MEYREFKEIMKKNVLSLAESGALAYRSRNIVNDIRSVLTRHLEPLFNRLFKEKLTSGSTKDNSLWEWLDSFKRVSFSRVKDISFLPFSLARMPLNLLSVCFLLP